MKLLFKSEGEIVGWELQHGMDSLVSLTRDRTSAPSIGSMESNHQTAREFPVNTSFDKKILREMVADKICLARNSKFFREGNNASTIIYLEKKGRASEKK